MTWHAALLERELSVFRQESERISPKHRPHFTPARRLEILQIMRLRDSSATETASLRVPGTSCRAIHYHEARASS